MRRFPSRLLRPAMLAGWLACAPALAQSSEASQASALSLEAGSALAAEALAAIPAGSALLVQALRPAGRLVEVVLVSAATGATVVLWVAAETVRATALVVGATLVATAVSAGHLLVLGTEVLAFVPDAATRALIHHRELRP